MSSGLHAWKSILKGKEVIKRGVQWGIGTGDAISIWKDSWLPSLDNPKTLSLVIDQYSDALVKHLILPFNSGWNIELLDQLFTIQEVDMIKRIRLSRNADEDKLVWHCLFG